MSIRGPKQKVQRSEDRNPKKVQNPKKNYIKERIKEYDQIQYLNSLGYHLHY